MARAIRFDRLARGVVASTLALLHGGCSGVDVEGMEPIACDEQLNFSAFEGLSLAREVDSLDLVADEFGSIAVVASLGTRCATATDVAACNAAVDGVVAPPVDPETTPEQGPGFDLGQCVQICLTYTLVATKGDEVLVIRDAPGVKELLGAVDTATEAAWMVQMEGYNMACDDAEKSGVRAAGEGWEVAATKVTSGCDPVEVSQYLLAVDSSGAVAELDESVIESDSGSCIGRRPTCASVGSAHGRSRLGAHLASLAQLEAASVPAFAELARELAHLGAPRSLVRRAHRARRDEVRHARVTTGLARRHGGRPVRRPVPRSAPRPLVEVAIANAGEGCVREAFGAVIGRWQALHARDISIRAAMVRIARDEATHAALSFAIDAWAMRRLDPADRARVDAARAEALVTLREEIGREAFDPGAAAALGMPAPAEARLLLDAFARALA